MEVKDILLENDPLVEAARDSLGSFCSGTCKAQCCKKGYLPVSAKESLLFETDLPTEKISLSPGCMHLKDSMCSIYERRPKACREFPLYEKGKTILVATWCEGYKAGLLDEQLKDIEKKGFKILLV